MNAHFLKLVISDKYEAFLNRAYVTYGSGYYQIMFGAAFIGGVCH